MNKSKLLFLLTFAVLISHANYAQTITVSASPLTLPCGGGNVNLTAVGNSTTPVFGDNFNNGQVASGWYASPAAQFDNPCGASVDGTTYLWMGPGTAAPRNMTTAPVNVSCGGTVCFDFKFVCESCGDSAPCEGADTYAEGVSLQCSTDGGTTWTDFAYFAPNGDLLTAYPGNVYSPYASGNTPFTTWQNYCFTIPAGCETANTQFQLYQWGSSGTQYDHWGIDNFYVYANPCAPYYYDWDHIPGAPDSPNVTTNITQTTTFTCCYTNGTNSVCESVTVVVDGMTLNPINTTTEPCLGDNAGTASISVTGGTAPYTYTIAGPSPGSNSTGNFANLAPGNYSVTVNDNSGCQVTGNFTITPGPACCTVSGSSVDALCNGQSSGSGTANPANGVAPYTYQWDAGTGNQTTQTANNLSAGTYSVTITDNAGCTASTSVTVGEPTALNATQSSVNPTCFGACNGQIVVNAPSGGTAPYQYNLNGGTFGGSGTFTGLCAGTYNVIVQDTNGCQFPISNILLTEPTDLTLIEQSSNPATCGASNGDLTVTAGGGTSPYQYDIGGAQQGSPTFTGLAAGSYTVTVTDANGCTETVNVTVGSSAGPAPFIDVQNNVTCAGAFTGSITIGVTGGTAPFTFVLNPPNAGQASNSFTGVPAGPFTVEVTDNNGCVGTVSGTITEPSALTFSSVPTDASCNGLCDGEINVTANNATPPYSYSADNGLTFQPGNVLTGLCAGNIDVVVSDANGCLANAVVAINEPSAVTLSPTFVEPSCNGLSDGTITFSGAGGTPGYTYSVDNGSSFSGSDPVTGISAGFYELVIADANGCQATDTITVTEPPPFTFNYIANNPSNCGANDGSFEITAVGGAGPYFYSIDGGVTVQVNNGFFLNLYSGLYMLHVTDGLGCVDSTFEALSDNVMITQTDAIVDATCYNSCDGLAIVSQQFGAPPFTYTLDQNTTGQATGVFPGLCAGTHYITIEDNGLCIGIEQVDIAQPDSILFDLTADSVNCPQGSDGQINVSNTTGGDGGPYTYSIDGGVTFQASTNFSGLPSGTYTIIAQDGNGCLGTDDVTIYEPAPWNINLNQTDLVCNGDNTGFVQVIGGGATGPYTYTLGGTPSGTGIYPGLSANPGGYAIQIIDANGCTFDTIQVVNEPTPVTGTYTPIDALCTGSADGQIDVTANGGTPPYLYSSDNGTIFQSSNVLTGLTAGCYDVVIKDNNGCQIVSNQCLGEPTQLTMTLATNPATCGSNNADVTITAAGGSGAYQYSSDNGSSFQAINSFTGLAAANYTILVEDANGCQIDSLITLIADPLPQIDNVVFNDPLCNGSSDGDLAITSSNGVGVHQYSIDNGLSFQASGSFTNLSSGIYDIVVEDGNGCQVTQQTTLTDPPLLTFVSTPTDLLCNNDFTGQIVITENGGTAPYQYSIDNGTTFQGGGTFAFIAANTYDIMVEDANGCQTTGTETVNEPAALSWTTFNIIDPICFGACDGEVQTVVGGGTAGYTYNWSGNIASSTSQNATGVCDGTYSVTVTDANGCQLDSNNFVLSQPAQLTINGVTSTDVLCYNGSTGTITIDAPGMTDYAINGPVVDNNGTGVFNGLPIGNYDITVTDINGCTAISNTTIYQPDSLYSIPPSDWPACYSETVTVQAFSNGGSVPYTYEWTNNLNGNIETSALFNFTVTDTIVWTLQVTDANGCQSVPVSYTVMPSPPLSLTPTADTNICLGGNAVLGITVSGGQLIDFGTSLDYSYAWSPGTVDDTLNTFTVSPTTATTYTITVEDLCGEIADTTINVGIHPDPVFPSIPLYEGCSPDTFDLNLSVIDPSFNLLPGYTIIWALGNGTVINSSSTGPYDAVYPYSGLYNFDITITTDQGCTADSTYTDIVQINDPPVPGFYFNPESPSVLDPSVQVVDISQNAVSYAYTFEGYGTSSDPEPYMTFPVEEETTIEVCQAIVSTEGCPAEICIPLDIHEEILFYVPNAVTPDGDLFNESFTPVFTSGVDPYNYHLTIFNRWGEIVFESFDYDRGWNCHYGDGGLVEDGVYIWQIEFGEKLSDRRQTHRGHVTVLK
ncbi:MAG: gliding motility-associated C-terminal domain-containing protein [Crocinitomicaceae bacterium]|nr:gliding motility-associated C-terminal domain-containing protein [Crocinitomicaceae bacterium]